MQDMMPYRLYPASTLSSKYTSFDDPFFNCVSNTPPRRPCIVCLATHQRRTVHKRHGLASFGIQGSDSSSGRCSRRKRRGCAHKQSGYSSNHLHHVGCQKRRSTAPVDPYSTDLISWRKIATLQFNLPVCMTCVEMNREFLVPLPTISADATRRMWVRIPTGTQQRDLPTGTYPFNGRGSQSGEARREPQQD
jgi:hypothetical protein